MTWINAATVVFQRELRMNLARPAWIVVGLLQPVLYLVLFGPLLMPLAPSLGTDDIYRFFVPGLLVQMGFIGLMAVGFGILADRRFGVIDSQRVTPAPRSALLMGRVGRDVVSMLVQVVILVVLGTIIGMRANVVGVVVGIVLCLLLGVAASASSYALALILGSEMSMAPIVNGLMLPILLLSGILLPTEIGPTWLRIAGRLMPTHYVVEGLRSAFAGDIVSLSTLWGIVAALALAVAGTWWGTVVFARRSE